MANSSYQQEFWDAEAPTADFTHPLQKEWLTRVARLDSAILDYGCGYGRTLAQLKDLGFTNLVGYDTSGVMVERARSNVPDVRLEHGDSPPCPFPDASFDLVILFAVLTGIPHDSDQDGVIRDILRLLRPAGHLYVSDLPLQSDPDRVERYRTARPKQLPFGSFEIDGGRAVMRHHTEARFDELFADFNVTAVKHIESITMRGRSCDTVQYLLRKHTP